MKVPVSILIPIKNEAANGQKNLRSSAGRRGARAGDEPSRELKPPKGKSIERQTCAPDVIDALRDAQPSLRDQIAMQLLGRLGLRKNELRLLQVGDFDVARGTVRVHDKGGKIAVVPLGFKTLKRDLQVHLVGRGGGEYLIYPKQDTRCGR